MAHIIDEKDAPEIIRTLKQSGRFTILHTGCYEVLHAGHLACFTAGNNFESPGKQTHLIVGVESDSTLRLNRSNKERPLFTQEERMAVVAELRSVDLVIRFNPVCAVDYADTAYFTQRLKELSPDSFLISYNNAVQYLNEVMQLQVRECADAGVAILPVVHHIRTHASDAVDLLDRPDHLPRASWLSKSERAQQQP